LIRDPVLPGRRKLASGLRGLPLSLVSMLKLSTST
jgi:hypothetical protein